MFLSLVDRSLVQRHLSDQVIDAAGVDRLLEYRAIPDGAPVFLDEAPMLPVEPSCSWFRHLAYEDKDEMTLREYAYIVRRVVHFLQARGRDLLAVAEPDLKAYQVLRTEKQDNPVGDAMWGKEAQLVNQLYEWLVKHGYLSHRPVRMTRKGRNPLAPRLRRGTDIRHMTLQQFRYFRDVGLAGQLPDSQSNVVFRGQASLRNRAADLALSTGMRGRGQLCYCPSSASAGPGRASQWSFRCRRARSTANTMTSLSRGALDSLENFLLLERPELVAASARPTSPQFRHEHHVQ